MSLPAQKRATYADLLACEDSDHLELVDGQIVRKAGACGVHAYAQSRVVRAVGPSEDEPEDGWWILVEPHVRFAEDRVLCPDLAGWLKSRFTPDEGVAVVVPDWVCEVLSPGHVSHDRVTKRAIYADEGVGWLWIASPEDRTLEFFERKERQWVLVGTWDSGVRHLPPFAQLAIDVERLFVPRRAGDPPIAREPEMRWATRSSSSASGC